MAGTESQEKEPKPKVVLLPCSGRAILGVPRGHVYIARSRKTKRDLGEYPLYKALQRFPGAIVSESDSLCRNCIADIRRR